MSNILILISLFLLVAGCFYSLAYVSKLDGKNRKGNNNERNNKENN